MARFEAASSKEYLLISVFIGVILGLIFMLAGFLWFYFSNGQNDQPERPLLPGMYLSPAPSREPTLTPTVTPLVSFSPVVSPTEDSVNISVDFVSQAPYRVWDEVHNEACEEANIIMAYAWVNGIKPTPEWVETEIQRLTKWGLEKFNAYDTSAEQTALMAKEVYGLESALVPNPSIEDIKSEINRGNVVIMGMAGRLLASPYYKPPGPKYHMLLIKGYDSTGFITNDVGTNQLGRDFRFSYGNIMAAAHDWNGSFEMLLDSPAVAIVVSKSQ